MIELVITHAPTIALLFFFVAFIGIAVWALRPSNKQRFEHYAHIPLEENDHGRP